MFGHDPNQKNTNIIEIIGDIRQNYGVYDTNKAIKKDVISNEIYDTLEKQAARLASYTGVIKPKFTLNGEERWIAVLDCDTEYKMLAARHYLTVIANVGSAIVESSPGHFWLVCDYTDTVENIHSFMEKIPGVDERFIEIIFKRKEIHIRAFPKKDFVPRFGPDDQLNWASKKWYNAFRNFFLSDRIQNIVYVRKLAESIRDGSIERIVADPNFRV